MRLGANQAGCLLLGDTARMRLLAEELGRRGMLTAEPPKGLDLLAAAQEGLRAVRSGGDVCIAAEGEMWAAALSLAAQLCVDRIVLIAPEDVRRKPKNDHEKQIARLKGYARRNLFFCISEVLVLESAAEGGIDSVLNQLLNARIFRLAMNDQRWTNCEFSPFEAAARFLEGGEFAFSLAK